MRLYQGYYQKRRRVELTVIVTHKEAAPEPWYLTTNLEEPLESVRLYRKRMWIEESFRDAKTHLGLAKALVWYAERMERMMILVAIVMLILILTAVKYERQHPGENPQLTTLRKGVTMSVFQMGIELIRQYGFPSGLSSIRLLLVKDTT